MLGCTRAASFQTKRLLQVKAATHLGSSAPSLGHWLLVQHAAREQVILARLGYKAANTHTWASCGRQWRGLLLVKGTAQQPRKKAGRYTFIAPQSGY